MPGIRRYAWTTNEIFAHKKNVGEAVKLKDRLTSLEKSYGLVTDTLKQDIAHVRIGLRGVRRSTGHSIDALPPTPFRLDTRCHSFMSVAQMQTGRDSVCTVEDKGKNYMPYYGDKREQQTCVSLQADGDLSQDETHFETKDSTAMVKHESRRKNNEQGDTSKPSNCNSREKKPGCNRNKISNVMAEVGLETPYLDSQDLTVFPLGDENPDPRVLLPRSSTKHRQICDDFTDDRSTQWLPQILQRHQFSPPEVKCDSFGDGNADVTRKEAGLRGPIDLSKTDRFLSPVSREITDVLKEGLQKTRSYDWQTSLVGLEQEETTFHLFSRESRNIKQSVEVIHNASIAKPKERKRMEKEGTLLRDARSGCRTCMERFRQNVEDQALKLIRERQARETEVTADINKRWRPQIPRQATFLFRAEDVESVAASSLANISRTHLSSRLKRWSGEGGNSLHSPRRRLEELAQPKPGGRRKMLLSKHIIKKELDSLTERHEAAPLTDREQRRLRLLESKVRMFLARMQPGLSPATMVHIPQREDVMKVDISHL